MRLTAFKLWPNAPTAR